MGTRDGAKLRRQKKNRIKRLYKELYEAFTSLYSTSMSVFFLLFLSPSDDGDFSLYWDTRKAFVRHDQKNEELPSSVFFSKNT